MKAKTKKKLAIILTGVILFYIIIAVALPKIIDLNQYKGLIISKISTTVQGTVELGSIHWGISNGLWIQGESLGIKNASKLPLDLHFQNIYLKISLLPLLSKKIEISELRFESPKLWIKLKPVIKGKDDPPKAKGIPVKFLLEKLIINNGKITIVNEQSFPGEKIDHIFNDINMNITDIIPGGEIHFSMSFKGTGDTDTGFVKISGDFQGLTENLTITKPRLSMNLDASSLEIQPFKPYLKNLSIIETVSGQISFHLGYEGDLGNLFTSSGSIDLTNIVYQVKNFGDNVLPGSKTILDYKIKAGPKNLKIETMNLKTKTSSVNARALIQDWQTHPVLLNTQIAATISTMDIDPMIPWEKMEASTRIFRPMIRSQGKIEIEKFNLPKIDLTTPFPGISEILKNSNLNVQLFNIPFPLPANSPKIECISSNLEYADNTLFIKNLKSRMPSADMPDISGKIINLFDDPIILARTMGEFIVPGKLAKPEETLLNDLGIDQVSGKADLDLDLKIKISAPGELKLTGNIALKDFNLKTSDIPLMLNHINATIDIKPTALSENNDLKSKLPSWAEEVTADLTIDIDNGSYKTVAFSDLKLVSDYENGTIKSYRLDLNAADGKIAANGTAVLKDLNTLSYTILPLLQDVQLEKLSPIFGMNEPPLTGPVSFNGNIEGLLGDSKKLVSTLKGKLNIEIGQGKLSKTNTLGRIMARILTIMNLKGLISGDLTKNLKVNGMPFDSIMSRIDLKGRNLNISTIKFNSNTLNGTGFGTINYIDQKLKIEAIVEPFETANKVLGFVPILGKPTQALTKVYFTIEGPFDNPKIYPKVTKGVRQMIKKIITLPIKETDDTRHFSDKESAIKAD